MKKARRVFSALLKHWKITAPIGVATVGAAVTAIILTTSSEPAAVAYANVSRNFRVCMLTTTKDTADASRVWPAIQAATAHAPINAERVTAPAGTDTQLVPYVNSLIALRCGLIIGAGHDLTAPLTSAAKSHATQHFITLDKPDGPANVAAMPAQPADLTAAVLAAANTASPAH
ncbi:hypothetical protein [Amycolatopsis sp. WGS_07]|uniref:hypothetical protein n=1 Tax=Amycolatopsis sp. WGS_07 TaxID=3076764 RepID=UPI003873C474